MDYSTNTAALSKQVLHIQKEAAYHSSCISRKLRNIQISISFFFNITAESFHVKLHDEIAQRKVCPPVQLQRK